MQEFKVNDLLTLKLENDKTVIYVKGKQFQQCKYLLMNKKVDELEDLLTLDSVDDMIEELDHSLEENPYEIPTEVEFWGHCSNLQVWYENDYDTIMIHSNLAFPLLKELSNAGDVIAKRVFKEEILKRLEGGSHQVITFLIEEGYINYLNRDDLLFCMLNNSDAEVIYEIEKKFNIIFNVTLKVDFAPSNSISIENKKVIGINLSTNKISQNAEELFKSLMKLNNLEVLDIIECGLTSLPSEIGKLKSLHYLEILNNQINVIPESLGNLINLIKLNLAGNGIKCVPESLGNLVNLDRLDLSRNQIVFIPESLGKLKKLQSLDLEQNQISKIPDIIGELNYLSFIKLRENPLNQPWLIREMLKKKKRLRTIRI